MRSFRGGGEQVRRAAAALGRSLRTVIGAPDYARYCTHMRARHPGERMLTREEFAKERMEARYGKPGSRCC